ncbi:MFS transporter [Streptomyces cocklensis]|jgi:MFS family permease|uniref:MFS family arabinose efflux permease n=1 Tax=Actinacidiphila cocklensis TaxID=887465 RepID=A0A9W4DLQ0_9ACTN|nr:MFS transporter [Actinacidiphila cocklensis]MDD1063285.1 MFS transporter [Actinacidiphila cocklensis]CAG6393725.1 Putative MFS family arabinose efflux permease [Actinacidiphila cocklensis]
METALTEPAEARQAPHTARPRARSRPGSGRRNAVVLVGFTAATNLADGVMKMALPVLAARLTSSPTQVTAVSLTLTLPWLLVALHVGVLVDRFDRRRLLWGANGMRLAAMGSLTVSAMTGGVTLGRLFAAGMILGVADVLASTSASTLVPAAVPPAGRERVNTWMVGAETVGQEFAGPFVGGLLLAAGTGLALGLISASYAAAALVLLLLAGRFRAEAPAPGAVPVSVNSRIAEGVRFLWRDRLLRTLSVVVAVLSAVWGAWLALMPLYAKQAMHLGPQQYGIVLSALGVGGLAGAVSVTWVNRILGARRAMFADLAGTTAMVALPALTTSIWAVAAGAFLGGAGGTLWSVNARTITQAMVPDDMLGRYGAAARLFNFGAMPLGAALVGLLAELGGMRLAFGMFALATAATPVLFLRNVTTSALKPREDTSVRGHSRAST